MKNTNDIPKKETGETFLEALMKGKDIGFQKEK